MTVVLVAPEFHDAAQVLVAKTRAQLDSLNINVLEFSVDALQSASLQREVADLTLVISFGGDGTFLKAAAAAHGERASTCSVYFSSPAFGMAPRGRSFSGAFSTA